MYITHVKTTDVLPCYQNDRLHYIFNYSSFNNFMKPISSSSSIVTQLTNMLPTLLEKKKIMTLFKNVRHLTPNLQFQIHTFPLILNNFNIILLTENRFPKYCLALQFFHYSFTYTMWWTQSKHVISVLCNYKLNKKQNVANKSICMTPSAPRPSTCN